MRSLEELKNLYANNLKNELESLEVQRKAVLSRLILGIIGVGSGLILVVSNLDSNGFLLYPGLAVVLGSIILFILTYSKIKIYRHDFKNNVVKKIVSAINPEWEYNYEASITPAEYQRSELFRTAWDRYKGDDLVSGIIDKTDFRVSELHTEYRTVSVDSKGHRHEEWHTIFKGLFAHADFNKDIKGQTFVLPDNAERLFGKWGQIFQKNSSKGQLVTLENPEFEKYFVVYSQEQIEARYILTPSIMEAMVSLRKKYNRKMYFSFVGSRMYFAMSFYQDLFEPRIMQSGVRFNDIEQMFEQFNLISVIVQEMNLNTRIWTKD